MKAAAKTDQPLMVAAIIFLMGLSGIMIYGISHSIIPDAELVYDPAYSYSQYWVANPTDSSNTLLTTLTQQKFASQDSPMFLNLSYSNPLQARLYSNRNIGKVFTTAEPSILEIITYDISGYNTTILYHAVDPEQPHYIERLFAFYNYNALTNSEPFVYLTLNYTSDHSSALYCADQFVLELNGNGVYTIPIPAHLIDHTDLSHTYYRITLEFTGSEDYSVSIFDYGAYMYPQWASAIYLDFTYKLGDGSQYIIHLMNNSYFASPDHTYLLYSFPIFTPEWFQVISFIQIRYDGLYSQLGLSGFANFTITTLPSYVIYNVIANPSNISNERVYLISWSTYNAIGLYCNATYDGISYLGGYYNDPINAYNLIAFNGENKAYIMDSGLLAGDHVLTFNIVDAAGNQMASPFEYHFTVNAPLLPAPNINTETHSEYFTPDDRQWSFQWDKIPIAWNYTFRMMQTAGTWTSWTTTTTSINGEIASFSTNFIASYELWASNPYEYENSQRTTGSILALATPPSVNTWVAEMSITPPTHIGDRVAVEWDVFTYVYQFYIDGIWFQNTTSPEIYLPDLPNGSHEITTKAWNPIGESDFNTPLTINIEEPPLEPLILTSNLSLINAYNFTLSWSGAANVDDYTVFENGVPRFTTTALFYTIPLPATNHTSEWTVRANNVFGWNESNPISVQQTIFYPIPEWQTQSHITNGRYEIGWYPSEYALQYNLYEDNQLIVADCRNFSVNFAYTTENRTYSYILETIGEFGATNSSILTMPIIINLPSIPLLANLSTYWVNCSEIWLNWTVDSSTLYTSVWINDEFQATVNATQYWLGLLPDLYQFSVKLAASNADGNSSLSLPTVFSVINRPVAAPIIDSFENLGNEFNITWHPTEIFSLSNYTIEYYQGTTLLQSITTQETAIIFPHVNATESFYVKISANNEYDRSTWAVRQFNLTVWLPTIPLITSSAATLEGSQWYHLTWTLSTNATMYKITLNNQTIAILDALDALTGYPLYLTQGINNVSIIAHNYYGSSPISSISIIVAPLSHDDTPPPNTPIPAPPKESSLPEWVVPLFVSGGVGAGVGLGAYFGYKWWQKRKLII